MKGYKVFNSDWTCRNFHYEVGKTYTEDVTPKCCKQGFHFCKNIADCFNYYDFDPVNKVAEINALGEIDFNDDNSKCCTNKIKIVREITWHEVLDMVNTGENCSGMFNNGDFNSGDCNTGRHNSGDWNSGNYNSGCCNSGYWNSGCCNSGYFNSGNFNSGNDNSGDFNKTNYSNGCFNTEMPNIIMFNKPSDWTYITWVASRARVIMSSCPMNSIEWIDEIEKIKHPESLVTGGYLKYICREFERQKWWDALSEEDKKCVMSLPNFDKDIFKEITGIDVEGN